MVVARERGQDIGTDETLMMAYVAGDRAAFQEIVRRHCPALRRFILRGLSDPAEAEDLVQETLLLMHRARRHFDPRRRLVPWLFSIGLNVKREYLRGRRGFCGVAPELINDETFASSTLDPAYLDARREIEYALSHLSGLNREVVELHWFGGLSFPEVAQVLGVTTSAVKLRAHRSYAKLREVLSEPSVRNRSGGRA